MKWTWQLDYKLSDLLKDIKTDAQIAEELGCTRLAVRARRRKLGLEGNMERYDWSRVDWSKTDGEIATELGCNRKSVRNYRLRHGKPKAKAKTKTLRQIIEDAVMDALKRNNWSVSEASLELDVSQKTIYNYIHRRKIAERLKENS